MWNGARAGARGTAGGWAGSTRPSGWKPVSGVPVRAPDQVVRLAEVGRRHRDRAQGRYDAQVDLIGVAFDVETQSLVDHQRHRVQRHPYGGARRLVQRTRVAGGQYPDGVGAQRDRVRDGGVVDDAAVHEMPAVDRDRREDPRNGRAGQDGLDRGTIGEQNSEPGQDIGGQYMERHRCVLEAFEAQMVAQQQPQPAIADEVVAATSKPEEPTQRVCREHLTAPQRAPQVAELVERGVGSDPGPIERPDRSSDHEVGVHPAFLERRQHAHLGGS